MANYAGRRAVRGLYILFGVSLGSFVLSDFVPGDFYAEARLNPEISSDSLTAMKLQHHLDQPFIFKYCSWLESVVRGDWGFSLSYNMPVGALLWSRLVNTLLLTVSAMVLAWLVAVPVGLWLATGGRTLNGLSPCRGHAFSGMAADESMGRRAGPRSTSCTTRDGADGFSAAGHFDARGILHRRDP